jgi:hypothetical protein
MFDLLLRAEKGNSVGRMAAPRGGAGGRWSHSRAEGTLDRPRRRRGAGAARPQGTTVEAVGAGGGGGTGHRTRVAGGTRAIKRWRYFPHRLRQDFPHRP